MLKLVKQNWSTKMYIIFVVIHVNNNNYTVYLLISLTKT